MVLPIFHPGIVRAPAAAKPYVHIPGGGKTRMVIVPGVADGLLTAVDVAPYLAWFYRERVKKCHLLILSRRDPIPAGFGSEAHAGDMIRTVDELNFGPAVWECLSAAGPIGQWAAVKRPDLVQGLVLSSTYDYVAGRTRKVLEQWLQIAQQEGTDFFWKMIEQRYRPPEKVLSQLPPEFQPAFSALRGSERLTAILKDLLGLDQRAVTPRIARPTLVIGGAKDRFVSPGVQREMASRIANCHVEFCEGYGHSNDMENPVYHSLIDHFISTTLGE
jgi:pimeloyl-ACP methyl ester carboxylesterase